MSPQKKRKSILSLFLLLAWLTITLAIGRNLSLPFYYYWAILIPTAIFFLKKYGHR